MLIEVEVEDFVDAAVAMSADVAHPLEAAGDRLVHALLSTGGMAGDDPGGSAWGSAYDSAAAAATAATQNAVNACYQLATMFGQSARNYENAETASASRVARAMAADTARLPVDVQITLPTQPPPASGPGDSPYEWLLIAPLLSLLWPNGHQDRLRAAAQAWSASAATIAAHVDRAESVTFSFGGDALPETDDVCRVCNAVADQLRSLAHLHRSLADACEQFAHRLDVMHHEAIQQLESLAEWTAAIEGAGAVAGLLTAGAAEGPTQDVETARIGLTVERVGRLILDLLAAVGDITATLPAFEDLAVTVSAWTEEFFGARIAVAGVDTVRAARTVGGLSRTTRLDMAAGERISAGTAQATSNVVNFSERDAARAALPEGALRSAGNRFFRAATGKCRNYRITELADGEYRLEYFAPANNAGFGKLYVQIIDSSGNKVVEFKDTLGPNGLIERKFQERRPR